MTTEPWYVNPTGVLTIIGKYPWVRRQSFCYHHPRFRPRSNSPKAKAPFCPPYRRGSQQKISTLISLFPPFSLPEQYQHDWKTGRQVEDKPLSKNPREVSLRAMDEWISNGTQLCRNVLTSDEGYLTNTLQNSTYAAACKLQPWSEEQSTRVKDHTLGAGWWRTVPRR